MKNEELDIIESEPDWLGIARDAYATSTTYMDANLRPQWERNIKQWQGRHQDDSKYCSEMWQKRSKVFRPKTRAAVRKNEAAAAAAFFSTQDVVSVTPQDDSDELQQMAAEIMQGMLQFRLERTLPWFQLLVGAYQETQKTGVCVSYQNWTTEPGKDEPYIELIPPENFRIDPASDWIDPINSSPYAIHMLPMYVCDVLERMTNAPEGATPWFPMTKKQILAASDQHNDSTRLTRSNRREDPADNDALVEDYALVWVRRYIVKQDGVDWLYYTLGDHELLSYPVPLETVYASGERPYVLGRCTLETFTVHPASPVEMVSEVQNEINDITNQRLDNVKLAMNKRYFAKRGKNVDIRSLTRNTPGSVTLMDNPDEDVREINTPDVTSSSYQEQDRLNIDFDDVFGAFSNASVQGNRNLNDTATGMQLISDGANQVSEYQLRMFAETWVEPVLRQLVRLEQTYETDPLVMQFGANQSQMFKAYGLQQVTPDLLKIDVITRVNVGIGSTNPQTQVQRFFMGLQQMAAILGPQLPQMLDLEEVVKETFGKLGYRDGARFFKFGEQDPMVEQLQGQIAQLEEELKRKRSPELEAAQAAKLRADTVKTNVESAYAAMQAGQVVSTVPFAAQAGDSLLQSAGWQDVNGAPSIQAPGMATQQQVIEPQGNVNPMLPKAPETAGKGMMEGIETPEADGVR
jgi:hypothetical protein